jgi:hypothetical protein
MSLGLAILAVIRDLRAVKAGDEDDERDVADIDSGSGLLGIECVFPRPTRSFWRPPIQLRKGDGLPAPKLFFSHLFREKNSFFFSSEVNKKGPKIQITRFY